MNFQNELLEITSAYFSDELDYSELSQATRNYKELLQKISEQDLDHLQGRDDLFFANGKAIGSYWAALCIDDMIRTRQFIKGSYEAIKSRLKVKKSLHVYYAGTGPYATLLLPIIARLKDHEIKYTLMEINPLSFTILNKIISKLNIPNVDIELLNIDITRHIIGEEKPDIIISETMQNALAREQQVPIFLQLMKQAKPDTIFIPQNIKLSVGLKEESIPIEELNSSHYHKIKCVFEIGLQSNEECLEISMQKPSKQFRIENFTIGKEVLKGYSELVILTEIQIYNDISIGINESGLTTPLIKEMLGGRNINRIDIETQYMISDEPELLFYARVHS